MPIFNERGEAVEPVSIDSLNEDFTVTDDNDISGEKAQEVTEPASEHEEDEDTSGEVTNPDTEGEASDSAVVSEPDESTVQSKAENRRQAAARREREAAEARIAAQDEVVRNMNIMNPLTGKNCETYEEYISMKNSSAGKIREQLEQRGVDTSAIDKLIEEHPAVKEAKRVIDAAKAAEAKAKEATDNARFECLLADVSSVIPEIKEAGDLFKWEHFNKFSILVNGGVSPIEAAKTLAGNSRAAAAKQATLNKMASKSHLIRTKTTSSGGDYGISDAEYAAFLEFNPGKSREEAAAAYKKHGGKR